MNAINKQGPLDHGYVAGFMGRTVGIHARSLLEAKQRAVEHFKPKKKLVSLVWVELAELSKTEIEYVEKVHVSTS